MTELEVAKAWFNYESEMDSDLMIRLDVLTEEHLLNLYKYYKNNK